MIYRQRSARTPSSKFGPLRATCGVCSEYRILTLLEDGTLYIPGKNGGYKFPIYVAFTQIASTWRNNYAIDVHMRLWKFGTGKRGSCTHELLADFTNVARIISGDESLIIIQDNDESMLLNDNSMKVTRLKNIINFSESSTHRMLVYKDATEILFTPSPGKTNSKHFQVDAEYFKNNTFTSSDEDQICSISDSQFFIGKPN